MEQISIPLQAYKFHLSITADIGKLNKLDEYIRILKAWNRQFSSSTK
jgi:hypothetical protein